ncbi:MAG: hypothetical protein KIT24_11400 [Phycisphaeraceae bacterium]|nr:hypothetical protein [Phycisphaeraceae bacterium]
MRKTFVYACLFVLSGLTLSAVTSPAVEPVARGNPRLDRFFPRQEFLPGIPTPEESLGYPLGSQFTFHHDQTAYLAALAAASDRVRMQQYGQSHEGRPLHVLFISAPEHLARLDSILESNRRLADPSLAEADRQAIINRNPAIVWLSYNVHGNEPSPAETAMWVAYELAAGVGDGIERILNETVVVIDPMLNPDGHARYTGFYRSVMGVRPNPDHAASEHHEPWPGGRANHYLFDLNRDWVWLVHPESRSRVAQYRKVMPQVHIDYHEQGWSSPYFLGLGDDPYNTNIPASTRQWVGRYGDAMAAPFDSRGLEYSTKERFDYLYPGYGKVLPCYNGAIGMLCEQAGHGFAGVRLKLDEHNELTLTERARNHYLTSMATLEYTARHRREQLERFAAFFAETIDEARGRPETYFLSPLNDPVMLDRVRVLCESHGIVIEKLVKQAEVEVHCFERNALIAADIASRGVLAQGAWVVRTDQPMGRLVRALFERTTTVTHPSTYDITGWSVPLFFGLDAAYSRQELSLDLQPLPPRQPPIGSISGQGQVALMIDAGQSNFPGAIGLAQRHRLICRRTAEAVVIEGTRFSAGSLIVHCLRNAHADLDVFARDVANLGVHVVRVGTGMTEEGPVLGANANALMKLPRIALVRGSPANSLSFGEIWHLIDIVHPLEHTVVNSDRITSVRFDEYNVIVLPDGMSFSGAAQERIKNWVQAGGTLVCLERAATWAATSILELEAPRDPTDLPRRPETHELSFAERRDRATDDRMPGVPMLVRIDQSHPLAAGVGSWIAVVKNNDHRQRLGRTGHAIGRYADDPAIGERINDRNIRRLAGQPFMTIHTHGSGRVICIGDSVTLRGFMHAPSRLLLNAIMYGPSL